MSIISRCVIVGAAGQKAQHKREGERQSDSFFHCKSPFLFRGGAPFSDFPQRPRNGCIIRKIYALHNAQLFRNLGIRRADNRKICVEMSRNVQSGNTQNLKSTVIQRSFPKWSVAERRKTAAASDQAAVCACAHSRYFAGGSPSGLRV